MSKPRPSFTIDHDGETQALITKRGELVSERDRMIADISSLDEKLGAVMAEHNVTGLSWGGKLVAYIMDFSKTVPVKDAAKIMKSDNPRLFRKYFHDIPISYIRVP